MSNSDDKQAVLTVDAVAERAGVTASTLRRWVKAGAIPQYDGEWTPAASAHARIVAQLRRSGEPLESIVEAAADGRLALGGIDELFPHESSIYTLADAAKKTGLEPALIERVWVALGFSVDALSSISERDMEAFEIVAQVINSGIPLVAFLQLARVWSQALADIADAEARLIRMYVHEPMLREGDSGAEIASNMTEIIGTVLPFVQPLLEFMHTRYLQQYVEQTQIENVQGGHADDRLGRMRVTVGFVDMAGFTRFTEEHGEDEAFAQVERLQRQITETLPDSARLVKMTGDGVMLIATDDEALLKWSVGLVSKRRSGPQLRVGMHTGAALYRSGDYYGSAINKAARVVARAAAGEVVVSDRVRNSMRGQKSASLRFVSLGPVRLKGFDDSIELFRVESRQRGRPGGGRR